MLCRRPGQEAELPVGSLPPAHLPGEVCQSLQGHRRRRIPGGNGSVIALLGPGNELLSIPGRDEITAPVPILKQVHHLICAEYGLLQIGGVKAGPVQLQKGQGVDGVIL